MGLNAVYQAVTQLSGGGISVGGIPLMADTPASTPANPNAPPPASYAVISGTVQLVWPSSAEGYTFTRVQLLPPPGSTISKTVKGSFGDTGLPGWTTGSITLPAAPGGSAVVTANGTETILAAFS